MTRALGRSSGRQTPLGRTVMVQGTSSHAGKTTIVAGLCRLFARAGYRVAPFKAQNMSNNAAVTEAGGEVGRAQAMQARAARVAITVDMNPILLKPQSDHTSQVVVLGKVRHTRNAREYYELRSELWPVVTSALDRLRATHDIVVIEGAGSPAEINLAQYDIVNMRVARYAEAPVILVGDIERGGVFAALFGTVALLAEEERALIKGFVINKFRGDASLLDPGFEMLFERTRIPTLGVLPYLDLSRIPAEDAVEWDSLQHRGSSDTVVDVAIMRLPRVANIDEFQPLASESGVRVRFVGDADALGTPDLVVIPGTKSTIADLQWLRDRGLASAIQRLRGQGVPIIGICGGLQMLGRQIVDESGAEAIGVVDGLALLPIATSFRPEKITRRVVATVANVTALWSTSDAEPLDESMEETLLGSARLEAYEIHMGRTSREAGELPQRSAFTVETDGGVAHDGCISDDGLVVGTYLHGLFENAALRRALVRRLAVRKRIELSFAPIVSVDASLDRLADELQRHLDMRAISEMAGLDGIAP